MREKDECCQRSKPMVSFSCLVKSIVTLQSVSYVYRRDIYIYGVGQFAGVEHENVKSHTMNKLLRMGPLGTRRDFTDSRVRNSRPSRCTRRD